jgi:hypothetical protein
MKVALCLSGVIGSLNRWGKGNDIDYNEGYKYLKESIISRADTDIFIHSWSKNYEKELCELYKPVNSLFEEQIDFQYTNPKSFAIMSQGYTRKASVELALNSNIEYDFIVLTRFDLAWFKPIDFNVLDNTKIYAAGPEANGKINDFFFIANKNNMKKLVDSFNYLDSLENLNIKETKGTIAPSYHRAIWKHLQKLNLLPITKYIMHRPWGNPAWVGDIRLLRLDPNIQTLNE